MFESFRRALKTSKEMWNFAGYWSEVVIEYHKLTGLNIEQAAKISDNGTLLDDFCQRAMKRGMTARECAVAIFEQGFAAPEAPGRTASEQDAPLQGPFDDRNPRLAVVFHKFKDEVKGEKGYSVGQAIHPDFHNAVETDYHKYRDQILNNGMAPEQGFAAIVNDSVKTLLSTERKLADSPDQRQVGTNVALVIVLRVLFGGGPVFAGAIQADSYVTTLGILSKILTDYRALMPVNSSMFSDGAAWAIEEFLRRCESEYGPAPADLIKAQEAQSRLAQEFARHGLDFMSLHPVIHRALLDEVLVFGRMERTVEMFFETVALVQKNELTDDEKAQMLLEAWKARGKMYRQADNS